MTGNMNTIALTVKDAPYCVGWARRILGSGFRWCGFRIYCQLETNLVVLAQPGSSHSWWSASAGFAWMLLLRLLHLLLQISDRPGQQAFPNSFYFEPNQLKSCPKHCFKWKLKLMIIVISVMLKHLFYGDFWKEWVEDVQLQVHTIWMIGINQFDERKVKVFKEQRWHLLVIWWNATNFSKFERVK